MQKQKLKYEGKAKRVFETDRPGLAIIEYKDDATAFNARKKGTVAGKGRVNNLMTAHLYPLLEQAGVPTHFVELLGDTAQAVHMVSIIPVEVIVRNVAAGSFAARLGLDEGTPLEAPVLEYCYKSDELGDPLVSDNTPVAMGWAQPGVLAEVRRLALLSNDFLIGYLADRDIRLIDIKFEFGQLPDGSVVLADEISPDTSRLWDAHTLERLDKDRFRRDLGGVEDAYQQILTRVLT